MAGGILILVLVCALPAVSAAQDPGSGDVGSTTTTTVSDPPTTPAPGPATPTDPAPSTTTGSTDNAGGTQGSPGQAGANDSTTSSGDSHSRLAHKASTFTVRMVDFAFSPASITVHVGDIVTWRNTGKTPHTATANDGSFDTGTVAAGQSASHMFTQTGTFTYYCTIHPNMKGTVHVLAAAGGASSGGSSGASSSSSGQTEAQAVNSPNAAANSNHLAATGMAVGGLALVGLLLLASGLAVKLAGRRTVVAAPTPAAVPTISQSPAPASTPLLLALLLRRRSGVLVLLLALLLPVGLRLLGRQR